MIPLLQSHQPPPGSCAWMHLACLAPLSEQSDGTTDPQRLRRRQLPLYIRLTRHTRPAPKLCLPSRRDASNAKDRCPTHRAPILYPSPRRANIRRPAPPCPPALLQDPCADRPPRRLGQATAPTCRRSMCPPSRRPLSHWERVRVRGKGPGLAGPVLYDATLPICPPAARRTCLADHATPPWHLMSKVHHP